MYVVRFPKQNLSILFYVNQFHGVWLQSFVPEATAFSCLPSTQKHDSYLTSLGNPKDLEDLNYSSAMRSMQKGCSTTALLCFSLCTNPPWEFPGMLSTGLSGWSPMVQPSSNGLQFLGQCDLQSSPQATDFRLVFPASPRFKSLWLWHFLGRQSLRRQYWHKSRGSEDKATATNNTDRRGLRLYFEDKYHEQLPCRKMEKNKKGHWSETPFSITQQERSTNRKASLEASSFNWKCWLAILINQKKKGLLVKHLKSWHHPSKMYYPSKIYYLSLLNAWEQD